MAFLFSAQCFKVVMLSPFDFSFQTSQFQRLYPSGNSVTWHRWGIGNFCQEPLKIRPVSAFRAGTQAPETLQPTERNP